MTRPAHDLDLDATTGAGFHAELRPLLGRPLLRDRLSNPRTPAIDRSPADGVTTRRPAPPHDPGDAWFDHRPYAPGDPVRRIDWRLAARADVLRVRGPERLHSQRWLVVIDASASMRFAGFPTPDRRDDAEADDTAASRSKWRQARRLAEAWRRLGQAAGDQARVVTWRNSGELKRDHGEINTLSHALAALTRSRRPGERVVLLSDLLEPPVPLARAFARLASGGAPGAVLHVLHRDETDPPATLHAGRFRDAETRSTARTDRPADRIRRAAAELRRDWRSLARRHRLHYRPVLADQTLAAALGPWLGRRG